MIVNQEVASYPYSVRAEVHNEDPEKAVEAFREQIGDVDLAGVLFFCSPKYDYERLSKAFSAAFPCVVYGCTTAGEIGQSYGENSIVGIGLLSEYFRIEGCLIRDLDRFDYSQAQAVKRSIDKGFEESDEMPNSDRLGILLIDGLSVREELTIAHLYNSFDGMEIIGGSSGDYLAFEKTVVFANGEYASNAAVFVVIQTNIPFTTFKFQHFRPTEKDLVITKADTANRVVYEIDGNIAAEEYAHLLGLDIETLNARVFAEHPVMLEIGDQWYVRSIQKTNEDGSLTFYCAIDEGIPLTIAEGMNYVETLREQVEALVDALGAVSFTIGCDCILRKLELNRLDVAPEVEQLFRKINFIGFSSFGEQYNSIHVNQTLTGVAFGVL